MKTKLLTIILLTLVLSGCGLTYAHFNPETKEFTFWSGKEYQEFAVEFKNGNDSLSVSASKVEAVEGQKIFVDAVKAGVLR